MPWFKNTSLCPALLHEKQIRLPCLALSASSGYCLSCRCNAKFPPRRQDALPSQPTLLLLPAGNIFKTPCVSAINVLILQVQLQCHFFFGIFPHLPKPRAVALTSEDTALFPPLSGAGVTFYLKVWLLVDIFFLSQGRKPFDSSWVS